MQIYQELKDPNIKRYQKISFLSVLVFDIILQFIPLSSIFGYEFSVLNSILFFFISGLVITSKKVTESRKKIIKFLLLLLVVPVIISVIHTLFTVKCSLYDGALFYIVNTVPSVLFGISTGLLSNRFSPRVPRIIFFTVFFFIALIPLVEFYFNPQVYFYNLFLGYFPGTIYDEALSVDLKLIVYRLFNILYFISIIYFINRKKFPDYILSLAVIFPFFLFIVMSPLLGFSTTKWRMESYLGGKCITPHFEIIYDKRIDKAQLNNIIMHHEYYYNDLKKFYRYEPDKKVTSYLFLNRSDKSKMFGAENADIAKPWLNQIYTEAGNYNTTLKHEISHAFSAKIGTGLFKVAKGINPALIEGIAVASDPFYGDFYIDHLAALAYRSNYRINIEDLYKGFSFFGNVSSLSYIYSGSFCNFLIQKFGIDNFSKWYSGIDFETAYKFPMSTAVKDYDKYISTLNTDLNEDLAKLLFAGQTIFTKVCPRYIGSQLKKANYEFISGNFKEAENIDREILNITSSYSALSGLSTALIKQDKKREALDIVQKYTSNFSNSGSLYNFELLLADNLVQNNKFSEAEQLYNKLLLQQPNLSYKMIADLRIKLLQEGAIKNYISGTDSARYKILKKLNEKEIFYSSVPFLLSLAEELNIPKTEVMGIFDYSWQMVDGISSYSATFVSDYLMQQSDFSWGRKFSALAYRLNSGGPTLFLRSHFLKNEWIYLNHEEIMKKVSFIL